MPSQWMTVAADDCYGGCPSNCGYHDRSFTAAVIYCNGHPLRWSSTTRVIHCNYQVIEYIQRSFTTTPSTTTVTTATIIHCDKPSTATVRLSSTAVIHYDGTTVIYCGGHPLRQSSTATSIHCDGDLMQRLFPTTVVHCNGCLQSLHIHGKQTVDILVF